MQMQGFLDFYKVKNASRFKFYALRVRAHKRTPLPSSYESPQPLGLRPFGNPAPAESDSRAALRWCDLPIGEVTLIFPAKPSLRQRDETVPGFG
jgi:hypothetical protein